MILGAITGVPTPACLSAASNPVEAVTPPKGKNVPHRNPSFWVPVGLRAAMPVSITGGAGNFASLRPWSRSESATVGRRRARGDCREAGKV